MFQHGRSILGSLLLHMLVHACTCRNVRCYPMYSESVQIFSNRFVFIGSSCGRCGYAYISTDSTRREDTTCQLYGCSEQRLVDGHVMHDFCCRGHAQLAKARGEWPRPASTGTSICSLPGCGHLVHRDSHTGKVGYRCAFFGLGRSIYLKF